MIKTNELRIGNTVSNGMVVGITPSEIITIDGKHWPAEYVETVILTPELLEKLGFDKKGMKGLLQLQCTNICPGHDYWVVGQYDQIDGKGHLLQNLKIRYVHELQNLYFVLTGEELLLRS